MIVLYLLLAVFVLWLFLVKTRLFRPSVMGQLQQFRYAHRGLHHIKKGVPENSLLAFRLARDQGYGIELDVHLSRDGKLVVEHDDTLRRTCGSDLCIEETDWKTLSSLRLEGTSEKLPLLEDVFALVDGKVPLLIELKVVNGNWSALGSAVRQAVRNYDGPFCIESFDPRALLWFRRNAPEIPRGQLAGDVRKESTVSPVINFVLKNLLVHALSRPDFIAYRFQDFGNLSFRLCRWIFRPPVFFWTIRSKEGERISKKYGATPIFENFQ